MKKVALAAVSALAFMAGSAQAAIVNFTTPISVPQNIDGVYINFANGTTSTTQNSTFDFNPYSGGTGLLFYWGGDAASSNGGVAVNNVYLDLAPGSVISSGSTFSQAANGVNNETANFRTAGIHTLGFRFFNEGTGAVNYGYARIQTGANAGFPATVLGWSYENTGAAITVAGANGAVPEPATWGMMLLGMGMVGAGLRSRKQARVTFA